MSFNNSVNMLTIVWNEKRFVETKSARTAARRSVFRAATILLKSELKNLESQNGEIHHEINRCHSDLHKYNDKLQILDNMTQLATQSLEVYFQARMENLGAFVTEQCRIISDGIQEEADHWKEIHAMLQQKLVVPGDLRSYGGGNGLPRAVRQSPNFSQIPEEEEEEEEQTKNDVSTLLQARTLTPLLTQTLKKARLLASKLSQDTSMIIPPQLNISTTVQEETFIEDPTPPAPSSINISTAAQEETFVEEPPHPSINTSTTGREETFIEEPPPPPPPPSSAISENHVTLRDVSAIEMDNDNPNPDLSVSLLAFVPTINPDVEEEEQHQQHNNNKSIASTISDKTFVKTSLQQFSSEEESDDDDDEDEDDETVVEESIIADDSRPLLLTADRSIRRPAPPREEKHSLPSIKKEKVSFREPLNIERLPNKNTFDAEKSDYVPPTIRIPHNTSKLPSIPSAESHEEQTETVDQENPPIVTQLIIPVATEKRRATRRTTTRLFRECQNDNLPSQPHPEIPTKARYATRYSTRLAATVITEEVTTRRATRFTSE